MNTVTTSVRGREPPINSGPGTRTLSTAARIGGTPGSAARWTIDGADTDVFVTFGVEHRV